VLTTELILTMLPPSGPKCFSASFLGDAAHDRGISLRALWMRVMLSRLPERLTEPAA